MNKQTPPRRDSRFVSLRIAADELGLPYSALYLAVKRGEIATLSLADDARSKQRPVIYVLRTSLESFVERRLTKAA